MVKVEANNNWTIKLILSSGDRDEYPGCKLTIAFWRWLITLNLPAIIKPDLLQIRGKYNYDEYIERRYGFYLFDNHFNILYGRGDANFHREEFGEEQRWSCFLPWSEWRHIRYSLYDLEGKLFWSGKNSQEEARKEVPKAVFRFKDFDGEEIEATTYIEEREWRRGEGWFKWLSFFWRPKIRRSLDIWFNKETGKRKGSWKGGTIGHGIDMFPEELHKNAFHRYCAEHDMTFISQL